MTDLIERLRSKSPYLHGSSAERTMEEAAEEIARLRAALRGMVYETTFHRCKISKVVLADARRALEPMP